MSFNRLWISKFYTAGIRLYQQRCSAFIFDIMQCPAIKYQQNSNQLSGKDCKPKKGLVSK